MKELEPKSDGWRYSLECNVLVPAQETALFTMDGRVYEVLAPGIRILQDGAQTLIWRGLFLARARENHRN